MAAIEIMINSPLISDLIFKVDLHAIKAVIARSQELGMQTLIKPCLIYMKQEK